MKKFLTALTAFSMLFTSIPMGAVYAQNKSEQAYDVYVAVDGSDTAGDGSQERPYATIDKARQEARSKNGTASDPVKVYVGEGRYFVDEPINFTSEDSNVTYVGDNAVLTGAKTLTGLSWSNYTGNSNIKVAEADKGLGIDQLFVDSEQQILARYPNYDISQILQGSTTQADIKAHSMGWSNPAGGYIRSLHNYKWGGNSYKITGKDGSALGLTYEWIGDNNRGSGMLDSAIMVENIFEELDSPGEWYYDNANGKLYVYPKAGQTLDSSTLVEGAVTEEIFHVEGTQDGAQVTNLMFDGITLENTKRTMFTGEYVPLLRSDWCVVRSGALFIQDAEDVTFKNGTIRNIGGNAVFLSGHSKNVVIDNNEIVNVGSSGILAAGFPDSCREPSFWENPPRVEMEEGTYYFHKTTITDTTPGPEKEHYPREAVISNNHIQNVGIWEKQSSQVAVSVAYKIQILHNTMHDGPRAGINVGDGTFGGHELAYNDIFDVQKETDDHGMFNSWGRDRFWSLDGYDTNGNNGAAKEPYSLLDVIDPIQIHDNRMHFGGRVDGGSTFGIDLDDGSTNYEIYNNLCLNMGIKLREGFHRKVYNNILVNGQINLHCTYEDSYDIIERNIVVKGNPYSLAATDEYRFSVSEDKIDNNWFYDLGMTENYPDFWSRLGYDVNSVNADPMFKDTSKNDYTVENTVVMEQIGFKNFNMEQFGKPGCEYQSPVYEKTAPDGNVDVYEREQWLGATISALDAAIMSSTGAGGLDGVYMEKVPANSQAAAYGFKTGDVLKVMNGEVIGKKTSFVSKYDGIAVGNIVNFVIIRNQLRMELNFIKLEQSIIVDDQSTDIIYSGGTWEESTPTINWGNSVNCIEKTITAIRTTEDNRNGVSVKLPFTGTQIEFFGRVEGNMGDYRITIKDANDQVVQEEVCSAYNERQIDAQSIFVSDILPQGDYTFNLTSISGDYVVIDAFKVISLATGEADAIVVEPVTITDNGVRVTELSSNRTLNIEIPVTNNGTKGVELTAAAVISGNEGALETEFITEKEVTLSANRKETVTLEVETPEGSESKRLEIFVYNKTDGQPYAYAYTVDGNSIVHKDVTIPNALGNEVNCAVIDDGNGITIAAKGFAANGQALIKLVDSEGKVIAIRQVKVSAGGQAKAVFTFSKDVEELLTVNLVDERGTVKTGTVTKQPVSELVDLVASYDMSANNGKLIDRSGNGNDAAYVGFSDADFAAEDGDTVLTFDGTDKYVKLPAGLISTEAFIIEATFKTNVSANSWLWCLGTREDAWPNVTNYVFVSPKFGDGTIRAGIKDANTELLFANTGSIPSDTCTTVRVEFDRGDMTLIVDGKEVSTMETGFSVQDILKNGTSGDICGYIGKSLYIGDTPFKGTLTQFDIYEAAKEKEPEVVDKTALQETVKNAVSADKKDEYTADNWKDYEKALNAAKDVLADEEATQAEVDAAVKALQNAAKALKKETQKPPTPEKKVESVAVTAPKKVEYLLGEELAADGMKVTVTYTDGTKEDITKGYEIKGYDPEKIGKQTITVLYEDKEATFTVEILGLPFEDVDRETGDWYYDAVYYNFHRGIMNGVDKTHFEPMSNLARAQFAIILHNMEGKPEAVYEAKFKDVADGQWYTNAILWASSKEIVTGYTDGSETFGWGDKILREQMAVMMYRYAKNFKKYDVSDSADFDNFADAALVSGYAKEAMRWAVGAGIITGKDNGTRLDPQGDASRAECAIIIMRFLEKYNN